MCLLSTNSFKIKHFGALWSKPRVLMSTNSFKIKQFGAFRRKPHVLMSTNSLKNKQFGAFWKILCGHNPLTLSILDEFSCAYDHKRGNLRLGTRHLYRKIQVVSFQHEGYQNHYRVAKKLSGRFIISARVHEIIIREL